ncbi:MAG: leucine-rich repeat domain-containing protein [Thermoguttaceae bacterium]|nr:leucine-rich repeat domain-containing protein [Thermoguttaceae bacterium]
MSSRQFTFPDGVVKIKMRACCFGGCEETAENPFGISDFGIPKDISGIVIPDSVKEIGWLAFEGCTSLTSVEIPGSVTKIDAEAFTGCTSLTSVVIPDSVTKIGAWAFCDCISIKSVDIPDSVKEIGGGAFEGCTSLTEIKVSPNNPNFRDIDGVLFERSKLHTLPTGRNPRTYKIPDFVTEIGDEAFEDCTSLTSVQIPDSVEKIGDSAFEGCTSLSSADIPNSVTKIGWYSFDGCTSLTSADIPNSVKEIGEGAFKGCTSITEIKVSPNNPGFRDIEGVLFEGSKLHTFPAGKDQQKCKIPDFVTEIGNYAFYGCTSLTSVVIPDSVKKFHYDSFFGCNSLEKVYAPEGLDLSKTGIPDSAEIIRR